MPAMRVVEAADSLAFPFALLRALCVSALKKGGSKLLHSKALRAVQAGAGALFPRQDAAPTFVAPT